MRKTAVPQSSGVRAFIPYCIALVHRALRGLMSRCHTAISLIVKSIRPRSGRSRLSQFPGSRVDHRGRRAQGPARTASSRHLTALSSTELTLRIDGVQSAGVEEDRGSLHNVLSRQRYERYPLSPVLGCCCFDPRFQRLRTQTLIQASAEFRNCAFRMPRSCLDDSSTSARGNVNVLATDVEGRPCCVDKEDLTWLHWPSQHAVRRIRSRD